MDVRCGFAYLLHQKRRNTTPCFVAIAKPLRSLPRVVCILIRHNDESKQRFCLPTYHVSRCAATSAANNQTPKTKVHHNIRRRTQPKSLRTSSGEIHRWRRVRIACRRKEDCYAIGFGNVSITYYWTYSSLKQQVSEEDQHFATFLFKRIVTALR